MVLSMMAGLTLALNAQDISGWTRIRGCSHTDIQLRGYELTVDEVIQLAEVATQVKMCTAGSTTDCVTSVADSYPIVNLRNGIEVISHINGNVPCPRACVARYWTGTPQRLNQLWSTCYSGQPNKTVWQGCGNAPGVKWLKRPDDREAGRVMCDWASYNINDQPSVQGMNIYINAIPAPTASPTSAPSYAVLHPGHLANMTEMQGVVLALSTHVEALNARLGNLNQASLDSTLQTLTGQVSEANQAAGALVDLAQGIVNNVTVLQTDVANMKGALLAALEDSVAQQPPGLPSVEATGSNVVVKAAGSVQLQSGACRVDDLCTVSDFATKLRTALQQSLN